MRTGPWLAVSVVLLCGLITYTLPMFTMWRRAWLPTFLSGIFLVDARPIAPKVVIVNYVRSSQHSSGREELTAPYSTETKPTYGTGSPSSTCSRRTSPSLASP